MTSVETAYPDSLTVALGAVAVTVAVGAGPRILGYGLPGEQQVLAVLPDAVITHPSIGTYRFLGGHRLWRAPEDPAVTYQPDEVGATTNTAEGRISLLGPADRDGVGKEIIVRQQGDVTEVVHVLRNEGERPVTTAPWAITQFPAGGVAVIPQPAADPEAYLPNRSLVLWPYTDLSAPEVSFREGALEVKATARPGRFKIGWPNRLGWLAYAKDDRLFVKWGPPHDDDFDYPDMGASAQCFRDERFLELETVGPLATLQPGDRVVHREWWTLRALDGASIAEVLASLSAPEGAR